MATALVTAAVGDTGRPTVKLLLEKGFKVKALVRKDDERAQVLRDQGAEIILGDILDLRAVRTGMEGADMAYFCYPVAGGLVEAAVNFAQAAKENDIKFIVNMSQKQSRPFARSKATQNHWLSEQIFTWTGIPSVHLRVSFFAEWLLYIAPQIKYGRYVLPYDGESRIAPIAAADIARIIVGLFQNPERYADQALQLHGPKEYSHEELAAEVGRLLGKDLPYEQVTVSVFLELLGLQDAQGIRRHFEAITLDQREGLLAGTDTTGREIIGQPLMTVEDFINANKSKFVLEYPLKRA
ncbi:NmrA family NAD(P)-binding protein [Rhizobium sp. BK251]|uniref:NmrA family NAD(P)-binding protein n=1 Tax=Rhizobium sp. BK251 TaxID=2512125 RepID=UPI00104E58CE|nr:NmrA family NAD(P)-binding protein [Rhizobium sp. BK251]TCL68274.1 uncharacterized protein YbjT (DUF2867 family) [Rhizobium sp. BK251]